MLIYILHIYIYMYYLYYEVQQDVAFSKALGWLGQFKVKFKMTQNLLQIWPNFSKVLFEGILSLRSAF